MQIAYFISELPSAHLLDEIRSLDQLSHWMHTKALALRIAKCWYWGHQQLVNPLVGELEEGLIDRWAYDFIWWESIWRENLRMLIYQRGREIRTLLRDQGEYPFHSELELFQEILRAESDGEFLKCTKPCYVERAGDIKKLVDLKSKELRTVLPPNERKKLKSLEDYYAPPRVWLNYVLKAAQKLAEQDTLIQPLLKTYDEIG